MSKRGRRGCHRLVMGRWRKVLGHVDVETPLPAISAVNDSGLWRGQGILGGECVGGHRSTCREEGGGGR